MKWSASLAIRDGGPTYEGLRNVPMDESIDGRVRAPAMYKVMMESMR